MVEARRRPNLPPGSRLRPFVARCSLLCWTLVAAGTAAAGDIYKCMEPDGRRLYTSEKRDTVGKKCEMVTREVMVVPAARNAAKGAESRAPARDDAGARVSARERQRQILENELAAEQEMLAKAQRQLAEQEAQRGGSERNYARVEERLKPYQDDVQVHEKNVEALKRELNNLYR